MTQDMATQNSYGERFKENLRAYKSNIGIPFVFVALISLTMCYYLLNYLLFANKGEPLILTIVSIVAVSLLGVIGIALGSIKR